jgi:RalA-binding protein 1
LVNSKDYHDVHAVAGLLKLYLRELPSTVLTRERHSDFLHIVGMHHFVFCLIVDIEDKTARVNRLIELVHGLPKVNYELLRIMSKHLKRIVKRSQENKMTIRNGKLKHLHSLTVSGDCFLTNVKYPGASPFSLHH